MNSEIILKSVSLDFPIYDAESLSLRNKVSDIGKVISKKTKKTSKGKIVSAVKDINFEFRHGDRVALLGHNGSGKTTLLKLLAGIYSPTSGSICKCGETCSMLDIGFGFEQDATGFENILLSNIIRGRTKKEIDKILPEIAEFSGLGEFLDMPLRTYSSGMQARLAFSSVIANSPEILLIDEFFSTGDIEFSRKSEERVMKMMSDSSILVFASHDLKLLKTICDKGVCMENGKIIFSGEVSEAINFYTKIYEK